MNAPENKNETDKGQSEFSAGLETYLEARLASGEAWMMCHDCGAKLYSFDAKSDGARGCVYGC